MKRRFEKIMIEQKVMDKLAKSIEKSSEIFARIKGYDINCNTGDVFNMFRGKNRLSKKYMNDFFFDLHSHKTSGTGVEYACIDARIDEKLDVIVITKTIAFGFNIDIENVQHFEAKDKSALFNIELRKPILVEMCVIERNKDFSYWRRNSKMFGEPYYDLMDIIKNTTKIRHINGFVKTFYDFFRYGYLGANMYGFLNNAANVSKFIKTPCLKKKNGNKQMKTDELCTIPLDDVNLNNASEQETVCVASRVNDEWAVLRWFKIFNNTQLETNRLYVNKTQTFFCRNDLIGDFVYFGGKLSSTSFQSDKFILSSPDVFKDTKLEYFEIIFDKLCEAKKSQTLYMLTMFPEFEKMYKANLSDVCMRYINIPYPTPWRSWLSHYFNGVNFDEKSLNRILGFNKHQMAKIAAEPTYASYMKTFFDRTDLSDIDDESFDTIFDLLLQGDEWFNLRCVSMTLPYVTTHYSIKSMISCAKALMDISHTHLNKKTYSVKSRNAYRNEFWESSLGTIFNDVVYILRSDPSYTSRIKLNFKTIEELIDIHDILVDVSNANALKSENDKYSGAFASFQDKWKKFEYFDDEKFVVIAPKGPIDLAQEGIELKHCVKSYIPVVSSGETTVLFIRLKDAVDVPFFTMEVRDGCVRQVHGSCNRNANTEPGLEEFIKKWAKSKKIKCTKINNVLAA